MLRGFFEGVGLDFLEVEVVVGIKSKSEVFVSTILIFEMGWG